MVANDGMEAEGTEMEYETRNRKGSHGKFALNSKTEKKAREYSTS